MTKERKNPDFVDMEQANLFLTGFKQDTEHKIFIGRKRKRYKTFIFTDYPLLVSNNFVVPDLYDLAISVLHENREFVIYDAKKNLMENVFVTNKQEIYNNKLIHEEQYNNKETNHVESNILGLDISDVDLCNIANVISKEGKIYFTFERISDFRANLYMFGDKGWALFYNKYVQRNKSVRDGARYRG